MTMRTDLSVADPGRAAARQGAAPILEVRGLGKRFAGVTALDDVSLSLRAGEIRAICGENGAGKSTLVKSLTGIVLPDAGTIAIDGVESHLHSPKEAQARGINLVSQELSICPDLSVLDNIWLGALTLPFLHRRAELRRRAAETLGRIGAGHLDLDAPARRLSTGERQLVEIARMLMRDTRVLILDEPTATLSDQEIHAILAALRALRAHGTAILYITHRLGEVFDICDSVTVMRGGRVVADTEVAALDRDGLIELMLGRPLGEIFPEHHAAAAEPVLSVAGLTIPGATRAAGFSVPAGQIVCLTGQVGCGAEEIVRALAGLVSDAAGAVMLDGTPLPLGRPELAWRRGVRFVSGDRAEEGVFVDRPVWENLTATRIGRRARTGLVDPSRLRREAAELARQSTVDIRRLGLTARNLSGGNQQKLAFGRNLGDPGARLIVMIEPTRGIDVGARAEIYRLMRSFCASGCGLLVASTDFSEVLGLGDVIVTMFRGRIVNAYRGAGLTMPHLIADVTHPEA